uniref:Regulatory protein zeste n=1 Tax=Ditylenchus dipsaci TaxID=166011 RepID=A0A915CQV0_9BILA
MVFADAMNARLAELVKDNSDSLFPNSKTKDALRTQDNAWNYVTETFNKENPENTKTVTQIRNKWKNLKASAKEDVQVGATLADKQCTLSTFKKFIQERIIKLNDRKVRKHYFLEAVLHSEVETDRVHV